MLKAIFTPSLDSGHLRLDPIRVGRVPVTLRTPDRHVIVVKNSEPMLRIDVYADRGEEIFTSETAIVWRDLAIIGFGNHLHAVSLADRSIVSIRLESYFGSLHPTTDYLLAVSGERIFRIEPDRSVRWKSGELAIDGVIVHEVVGITIRGEGEWDPPGGWKSFAISAFDGRPSPPPLS